MTTAPALLIAAPKSGSGKTTITLGLQRAFTRQGLNIRGLKCGPDYIDPAFHAAATGHASYNLDSFAMTPELLESLAEDAAAGADLVIAEGSMGLFDGINAPAGRTGASADVAACLGFPVVLVLDVSGQAQSAAAVALGCRAYDPRITVAGVILNKVASARHERLIRDGMARIGMAVFGAMPKEAGLILPERHLGLVQAGETADLHDRLDRLADAVAAHVDLEAIRAAASTPHPPLSGHLLPQGEKGLVPAAPRVSLALPPPGGRIAVARDAAFSFLYPHLERGWRAAGASLHPFSPLADEAPDDSCDACWLPGGYPELHAGRLAAATIFRAGVTRFAETRPVHGECGGYMTLGESLEDADGKHHPMLGLLPLSTSFRTRKLNLGYRRATLLTASPLGDKGTALIGHEFHYATITSGPSGDLALARVTDGEGRDIGPAGHRSGMVSGTFFHVIAGA